MCDKPSFHSRFGQNLKSHRLHRPRPMSAGVLPSAASAPVAQQPSAPSEPSLRYAGHASVRLCRPSTEVNAWHLADCITMERKPLPPPIGAWVLGIDTDGFGAAVDTHTGQVIVLEDFLKRSLLVGQGGERYILERQQDGSSTAFNLYEKQTFHRCVKIRFGLGPTKTEVSCIAYLLTWPRVGGYKFMWRCASFYEIMRLQSYKGCSNKWASNSCPRWTRQIEQLGVGGQVLSSQQRVSVPDRTKDADNFLPAAAFSTFAVVCLLARWSSASPNKGGLKEGVSRACAESILGGLLDACIMGERSLHIVFASAICVTWPAPPHA